MKELPPLRLSTPTGPVTPASYNFRNFQIDILQLWIRKTVLKNISIVNYTQTDLIIRFVLMPQDNKLPCKTKATGMTASMGTKRGYLIWIKRLVQIHLSHEAYHKSIVNKVSFRQFNFLDYFQQNNNSFSLHLRLSYLINMIRYTKYSICLVKDLSQSTTRFRLWR